MTKLFQRLCTDAPLISDGALAGLLNQHQSFLATLATHEPLAAEHPYFKGMREKLKPQMTVTDDGIAIIPVEGVLARKPDVFELFYGVEDTNNVFEMVDRASRDNAIKGTLLDVDSPGGFMTGGPEVGDVVKAMSKRKPVVTWTGGMMASLGYWIGSQASRVIASRSAIVGSIGVFTTHLDWTKAHEAIGVKVEVIKNSEAEFKAAGIMGTALTESQRANIQERMKAAFTEFRRAVTGARADLPDDAMKGQVFSGQEGVKAGLVDVLGTREQALRILRGMVR